MPAADSTWLSSASSRLDAEESHPDIAEEEEEEEEEEGTRWSARERSRALSTKK